MLEIVESIRGSKTTPKLMPVNNLMQNNHFSIQFGTYVFGKLDFDFQIHYR